MSAEANKSLQATRDGRHSSAVADHTFWSRVPELGRYMASTVSSAIRPLIVLVLACLWLVSCDTPSSSNRSTMYSRPPIGTFVSHLTWRGYPENPPVPLVTLRLDPDGRYIAEDGGPIEYGFIVEDKTLYPQRSNPRFQQGSWRFDDQTSTVLLSPDDGSAFRWGIRHLRISPASPDQLEWGGDFLKRL
jgi:hypothetical protein